jgi:hypothetical protein
MMVIGGRVRLRQEKSSRRAILACDNEISVELLFDDESEEIVTDRSLISDLEDFERDDEQGGERDVASWKALGNKLFSELRDYEAADEYYQHALELLEPKLSIGQTVAIEGENELTEAMISSIDDSGDRSDLICLWPPENEDEELDNFPSHALYPITNQPVLQSSLYLNRTRCLLKLPLVLKQNTSEAPACACTCAARAAALLQHATRSVDPSTSIDDQLQFSSIFLLAKALIRSQKLSEAKKVASKLTPLCDGGESAEGAKRMRQVWQLQEEIKDKKEAAKKSGKKLAKEVAKWVGSAMKGVECSNDGTLKRDKEKKAEKKGARLVKRKGGQWAAADGNDEAQAEEAGSDEVEDPEDARAHASRRAWLSFLMLLLVAVPSLLGWLITINGYMEKTDGWHHVGVGMGITSPYDVQVSELYARHNPDNLGRVHTLLKKYAGREQKLLRKIRRKYERGGKKGQQMGGKKISKGRARKTETTRREEMRREEMEAEAEEHMARAAGEGGAQEGNAQDDGDEDVIDLDALDSAGEL